MLKPIKPAHIPKIKYKVPISLWFVDAVQRKKDETLWRKTEEGEEETKVY